MKLYEELPKTVRYNGREIKVDLDFRNVLKMIDIMTDDTLMPEAREWLALKCICRHPKKGMMTAVKLLLFDKPADPDRKRIMDYAQDADLIRAAFQQVYGIDLYREKMHWMRFSCLLAGLPSGNRFSDILSIRSRPLPAPTKYNLEEREWLIKAKAECALKLTDKEIEQQYQKDIENIASILMNWAEKG